MSSDYGAPFNQYTWYTHLVRLSSRASLLEETSAKDVLRVELEKSVRQAENLRETLVEKEKDYQVTTSLSQSDCPIECECPCEDNSQPRAQQ